MDFLTIILGLLPGFVWLLFYLQEDTHPEPKKAVALVFAAGIISAGVALILEITAGCVLTNHVADCAKSSASGISLTPLLLLVYAAIEELVKFGAVWFTVAKTKYFNEPIDAMIYMVVAALGFATVENLAALYGQSSRLFMNNLFETATFRLVGTTLLHTLTAAIIGYFWALEIRNFKSGKFLAYGLILAITLHVIFNYLILIYSNLIYPIIFVAVVGFFILGDFDRLRGKKL
ncbi:MAG TPA: PrsW family glutamic-type intramembrane protease [Candidatus Paceibacterota bacterium]|nr:PrsW family glutamic-type intramembrane protease [Candidatus Paceibacterota bacterium]